MKILIINKKISKTEAIAMAKETFGEMVKGVIDINRKIIALGGELHADAEAVLLEDGSKQENVWGFNLYPEKSQGDRIQYSSLINIRPRQGNRAIEIQDPQLKKQIELIINGLIE